MMIGWVYLIFCWVSSLRGTHPYRFLLLNVIKLNDAIPQGSASLGAFLAQCDRRRRTFGERIAVGWVKRLPLPAHTSLSITKSATQHPHRLNFVGFRSVNLNLWSVKKKEQE